MTQIDQPIFDAAVVTQKVAVSSIPKILPRPATLSGTTYKIKTPMSDHALYLTINDHDGKPFEIFINSKAMEHFQWIVALTRVISAVFRHGSDVTFLVDELRSVCDPKGGFFKGGRFVPSLVSEIGDVLATHLTMLGLLKTDTSLAEAARAMVKEKIGEKEKCVIGDDGYPEKATLCNKCLHRAVVIMDSCSTCLNCFESRCG